MTGRVAILVVNGHRDPGRSRRPGRAAGAVGVSTPRIVPAPTDRPTRRASPRLVVATLTASFAFGAEAPVLRVPFVAQRHNGCAAAVLTMVLRYWGDAPPEGEMADALPGASAKGLPGSRLAEVARRRGHEAIAYEGDLAHLREYLAKGRPLVVALKAGRGGYHDVVVLGFDDSAQEVIIHDPAVGPGRRLPVGTFEKRWAGAGHWTLLVMPARP